MAYAVEPSSCSTSRRDSSSSTSSYKSAKSRLSIDDEPYAYGFEKVYGILQELDDEIYNMMMSTHPHDMTKKQIALLKVFREAVKVRVDQLECDNKINTLQAAAAKVVSGDKNILSQMLDWNSIQAPLQTRSSEMLNVAPGPVNPLGLVRELRTTVFHDPLAEKMTKYQNVLDWCDTIIEQHYAFRFAELQARHDEQLLRKSSSEEDSPERPALPSPDRSHGRMGRRRTGVRLTAMDMQRAFQHEWVDVRERYPGLADFRSRMNSPAPEKKSGRWCSIS